MIPKSRLIALVLALLVGMAVWWWVARPALQRYDAAAQHAVRFEGNGVQIFQFPRVKSGKGSAILPQATEISESGPGALQAAAS